MGRGKRAVGPITQAIAAELRAERGRAGMTIRELTERSGVPRTTLGKMLQGEAAMDAGHLYALCATLGVSLTDLVARAEATLPDPGVDLPEE